MSATTYPRVDRQFGTTAPRASARVATGAAPEPARSGVWIGVAAISMCFAALTSALVIRAGAASDWRHIPLPPVLYANALLLLASSFTLEVSRHATFPAAHERAARWLYVTLALGLTFVAGQVYAWRQLRAEGLFLASSPNSSFFYVLTALHGLHVLGGLAGLTYMSHKLSFRFSSFRVSSLNAAAIYWHFMDGLWVYLLFVLQTRL